VDRLAGEPGECRVGRDAVVSSYGGHFGEEPPISGRSGSGTIFFAGCNLHCRFCQNHDISWSARGLPASAEDLAHILLELQAEGRHNANLVSPTHVTPQILDGLALACEAGLAIPLVWNSGGYDLVEMLELLDGVVDVYMPDLKYADAAVGARCSGVPDYPEVARAALREMHRQVGVLEMGSGGVATRGVLVRHLVLPGGLAGTAELMRFLAEELSPDTYVNVMAQYRPCHLVHGDPLLGRHLTGAEHREALAQAREAGLHRFARDPEPTLW
jgi:putative pyruvate formate lyase activating enzyme